MCFALALLLLARRQRLPAPLRVPRSAAAIRVAAPPSTTSKQRTGVSAAAAAGSWSLLNDLVEGAEIVCMAAAAVLVAYSRVYLKYHSLEQVGLLFIHSGI